MDSIAAWIDQRSPWLGKRAQSVDVGQGRRLEDDDGIGVADLDIETLAAEIETGVQHHQGASFGRLFGGRTS